MPRAADPAVRAKLFSVAAEMLASDGPRALTTRLLAAGAGIGAFFCPTGVGTPLVEGKETRAIDGRQYALEYPIHGDVALIGAHVADRAGNLLYRKTARNFGPVMATAASLTVVEVSRVVDTGQIDPETVVTPGIYVDRVLDLSAVGNTTTEAAL